MTRLHQKPIYHDRFSFNTSLSRGPQIPFTFNYVSSYTIKSQRIETYKSAPVSPKTTFFDSQILNHITTTLEAIFGMRWSCKDFCDFFRLSSLIIVIDYFGGFC